MKKLLALMLGGLLLSACSGVPTMKQDRNANEIAPYPAAEAGYVRSVIYLPELKDESQAKVELIIGKEMTVDCNNHGLLGKIKTEQLKGWGYPYYVVEDVKGGFSTMMACPPGYENKTEFIRINSDLGLMRYNSKLPIVVYAPQDVQVKYQIWNAGELNSATNE